MEIADALHAAVRSGNLREVLEILAEGADVEAEDPLLNTDVPRFGVRPVHVAAEEGHVDVLKALIARGCNVNARASCPVPLLKRVIKGMTPLHFAVTSVENPDPNVVLTLISAGASVNAKTNTKMIPLHFAAKCNLPVVKALVSAKSDVNAEDERKFTPLFYAVLYSCEDITTFLVQNGAVINGRDLDGLTPLHMAAGEGNVNIAKLFLQNKAAINAKSREGFTPLHLAIHNRHAAVSQLLIDSGADVNARDIAGWTPLQRAACSGYPAKTARLLIAKGASVNVRCNLTGTTPLHQAAKIDFTDMVNILIENKADVNATDNAMCTPLHIAALHGNLDTIKILTAQGAKVDARNHGQGTPLHLAAMCSHVEIVRYLLAKGADVNATDDRLNFTAVHFAADEISSRRCSGPAKDSVLNTIKALIEYGANINAKGRNDLTALYIAVKCGNLEVTRYLLENGAYYDVKALIISDGIMSIPGIASIKKNEHVIALVCAIETLFKAVKRSECGEIEKCLKEGAPVNSRSIKYGTPLMYASWKGHSAVVNILLKNGASVNLSNSNGVTPLHYAAKYGHHEILCTLLHHGAVYNARTKTGQKTPLHFAQEGGKKEVTETLKLVECMYVKLSK